MPSRRSDATPDASAVGAGADDPAADSTGAVSAPLVGVDSSIFPGLSTPDRALLKKKQRLARLVVHDLRNPLAALQGHLELMREDLVGFQVPETVTEGIGDCMSLVAKSLALLTTILDVEELEDGVLKARRVATEVDELVQRAASVNRPAMRIRQLRVSVEVTAGLTACIDGELTYRVLESLLDNAVRYAPRKGRVVVAAHQVDDGIEIAIGNDGPPVPDSERDAIFDRYYRIEERRANARAGRGLGLYFCRLAIAAQGGSLDVEQRGELGAVFVARLPR